MPAHKTSPTLPAPRGSLMAFMEGYLEALRVRGYSESSVKSSRYLLVHFCAFAYEREVMKPEEVSRPLLLRYQSQLYRTAKDDGSPISFRTQAGYLTALRGFFKWLCKERHILQNPAADLEMPRMGRRLPRATLTVAEVETLLRLPDVDTSMGLRDRAILEVFYSTAMRRGELLHLALHHLDFERGMVFIEQGKGKKDRYVPIGERALLWVRKYLADGRPHLLQGKEERALFLSSFGGPLSGVTLSARMRAYFLEAGLEKKGACHLFRHSAATLMLEGGADIRYIQQMLGHSDLSSTQVYTHVSAQKLKEVHTRTHPAKNEPHSGTSQP